MGGSMQKQRDLEELKEVYSYLSLSEKEWDNMYENALHDSTEQFNIAFFIQVKKYLSNHMTIDILKNYLESLTRKGDHTPFLEKRLKTFLDFLESIQYTLTIEDAKELVNDSFIKEVFATTFKNTTQVSENFLKNYLQNNENLEVLCKSYLEKHHIVVNRDPINHDSVASQEATFHQNIELFIKYQEGDQKSFEELVQINQGLVKKIASCYHNSFLDFDDLVQEGNIGLIEAIKRFDYSKGFQFSTYATWWIRQAIIYAISHQSRMIRLPVRKIDGIRNILKIKKQLLLELKREPTDQEIAQKMGMKVEKVQELMNISQEPLSLETPMDEEGMCLKNIIKSDSFEEDVLNKIFQEQLISVLSILQERELDVIKLRFGFIDGNCYSLEEIGKKYHVTKERIRQIEVKALKKLNHSYIFDES